MNAKLSEGEIKEIVPFTITSKRTKHLGISSPRKVKDLYSENYKTLIEIEDKHEPIRRYIVFMGWKNYSV